MTTIDYQTENNEIQSFERMTDKTFILFSNLIYDNLGIRMPVGKKTMLQARLHKRLRQLSLSTYIQYYEYVISKEGMCNELPNMVNVVTTNKTDFFREPGHFEFLAQKVLPEFLYKYSKINTFKAWSAGCSIGAEPYTIAMILSEFAEKYDAFDFSVFASDISTEVLQTAKNGIYQYEMIEPIPDLFRKKYLLRSKDQKDVKVKIVPKLRSMVKFKQLNFMDKNYNINEEMDIVFCRNVIIYFDKKTQVEVVSKICRHLKTGGYLFMGNSESLSNMSLPVKSIITSVYKKI